jgi:hypothetical protein
MITVELPPLPEPDGSATIVTGSERVGRYIADVTTEADAWSEPLVRAYARIAVDAALEAAAVKCEGQAGTMSMFAKVSDAHHHNATVRGCAAAIRSMKEQP